MLQGRIIAMGNGPLGVMLGFEYVTTSTFEPTRQRMVWALIPESVRTTGYSYCRNDESVGREATLNYGVVSCYLGNGNYVKGRIKDDRADIHECDKVPCPKVRAGISTRWHDGRWQKYLKASGWVAA